MSGRPLIFFEDNSVAIDDAGKNTMVYNKRDSKRMMSNKSDTIQRQLLTAKKDNAILSNKRDSKKTVQ